MYENPDRNPINARLLAEHDWLCRCGRRCEYGFRLCPSCGIELKLKIYPPAPPMPGETEREYAKRVGPLLIR